MEPEVSAATVAQLIIREVSDEDAHAVTHQVRACDASFGGWEVFHSGGVKRPFSQASTPGSVVDHPGKYLIIDNNAEADFNILQVTMVNIIVAVMLSLYTIGALAYVAAAAAATVFMKVRSRSSLAMP